LTRDAGREDNKAWLVASSVPWHWVTWCAASAEFGLPVRPASVADAATDDWDRLVAGSFVGIVAGTLLYRATVALLTAWHVVVPVVGKSRRWSDIAIAAVAVGAAAMARRAARRVHDRRPGRAGVAGALLAGGGCWLAWGLIDQHVRGVFLLAPRSAIPWLWDLLFHGVGVAVALTGAILLNSTRTADPSATRGFS
jgi:hypothetical protein